MIHNTNFTTTATVTIHAGSHQGRQQWYADRVPESWQDSPQDEVRRVVVNFPYQFTPLSGESWEIRLQKVIPGIAFATACQKVAPPANVPSIIEGGAELIVSDCPEVEGNRFRRRGRVVSVEVLPLGGEHYLRINFEELTYEPIKLVPGSRLEPAGANRLQLHGFHRIMGQLHAYHGSRLVTVSRS